VHRTAKLYTDTSHVQRVWHHNTRYSRGAFSGCCYRQRSHVHFSRNEMTRLVDCVSARHRVVQEDKLCTARRRAGYEAWLRAASKPEDVFKPFYCVGELNHTAPYRAHCPSVLSLPRACALSPSALPKGTKLPESLSSCSPHRTQRPIPDD
jgi:hypothetical protein